MSIKQCDVVIIGAGLSGLSAGLSLNKSGIDCIILEARDRVGGRTLTKRHPSYGWVDVGASYVGPTQNRILRLAKEVGVETFEIYSEGDSIHWENGKPLRYVEGWPTWNPLAWLDVSFTFREIERLCRQVPVEAPWTAARADEWDRMTVQQWLDKTCWFKSSMDWCRQFVLSNVTAEAHEVSFLWLLWYVASADGVLRIWEIQDSAQERKFIGGSQQISVNISELLKGKVYLNQMVRKIKQGDHMVEVITETGDLVKAKYAIIAIPPNLQQIISFEPNLTPSKVHVLQRLPMGNCIKAEVWFRTPFWREKGLNGLSDCFDDDIIVGNTMDDTHHDGSSPALVIFIMGPKAMEAGKLNKVERKEKVLDGLIKIYGHQVKEEYLDYEDQNWMEETFTRGCYTCWGGPGVITKYKGSLREPHGRVYFAGTETAVGWTGYMDGAVQAGERAAREIFCEMGKIAKDEVWVEEPEFEDIPALPLSYGFWERNAPSPATALTIIAAGTVGLAYILKCRIKIQNLFPQLS